MNINDDHAAEEFYEIIINGEKITIPKQRIEQLADNILEGDGSLADKLSKSFYQHPYVDIDAVEDAPLIGNEPDESQD